MKFRFKFLGACLVAATVALGANHLDSSFEGTVRKLNTPEKVSKWQLKNMTYRKDPNVEDFATPREIFELRKDDCDGFAIFAAYCLKQHRYDARIFAVFRKDSGHAVCAYKEKGKWNIIDGGHLRRLRAKNEKEIADATLTNWVSCGFTEITGRQKFKWISHHTRKLDLTNILNFILGLVL